MDAATEKEALRQQMLLRALWRDARPGVVGGWMRDGARFERGLAAYRSNATALAERSLAATFPTVQQLVGDESFAALARAFWRAVPPQQGDIARWGGSLADFIAADPQLADEPYLADVARLEWAVHEAEHAADNETPTGLERLAEADPATLVMRLQPGCTIVASRHPVVTIWLAHRSTAEDRFMPVREAFASGRAETAFVGRRAWQAQVTPLAEPEARFIGALLAGHSLGAALAAAGDSFDFETWLIGALQQGTIAAIAEA